ncbi:hypothetical protein THAOC_20929, partial [Thalassiosira oceanica]
MKQRRGPLQQPDPLRQGRAQDVRGAGRHNNEDELLRHPGGDGAVPPAPGKVAVASDNQRSESGGEARDPALARRSSTP